MAYLATMMAVASRLEGKPAEFVASLADLQKERGSGVPDQVAGLNTPATIAAYLGKSHGVRLGGVQVPVLYFDVEGQLFTRVYPSITFEILDVTPRYAEYVFQSPSYQGDGYVVPVNSSTRTIQLSDGTTMSLPRMAKVRPVEHPFDIVVEVRAYAKDPVQSALLVNYVYSVFPPRHYLRVPQNDGSYRDWDMMYESYSDLDKRNAVRSGSPGVEREYCKVWNYKVEGYLDNTDLATFANLTKEPTITVEPNLGSADGDADVDDPSPTG
jgi:hypothetical protein